MKKIFYSFTLFLFISLLHSQPKIQENSVVFTYTKSAKDVFVAGDFNGWTKDEIRLQKKSDGTFSTSLSLKPGIYQYKFFVDGKWILDKDNSATINNFNNTDVNSVFVLTDDKKILLQNEQPKSLTQNDNYPSSGGTLYLNIIWHQHQPLYLDPAKDQLQGPWVRTHATKDYYDMAAILQQYPDVHYNVNLTSSLLFQLQEYYVKRLSPFVDVKNNRVDTKRFFEQWKDKTDPWIDLALKPTKDFNETDKKFLLSNTWNAFGISEVQIEHFPQYVALKEKLTRKENFSEQELREIKFWFYLAHFDPDFLEKNVVLSDGTNVNLTDIIEKKNDGKYELKKEITEEDCNRIIAETYKICSNVIPIHKKLLYNYKSHTGQIEIATTPFYHPILPLIYDNALAKICQPKDVLPQRFHYPQDADAQVAKAVHFYKQTFGQVPLGMWPGEGSVANELVLTFAKNGIQWIATDQKVLARSLPSGQEKYFPYNISDKEKKSSLAIVFRDTELSDKIGFTYQNFDGENAADDFIKSILYYAPKNGEPDRLLTVILDGENAWEWYRNDVDGKTFLNALYRKLTALYKTQQVVTVTMSEYMYGNPKRNVAAHSVSTMKKLEWLHPGSWINANYDTWIGEKEENQGWEYLLTVRNDLENAKIPPPLPSASEPKKETKEWYAYKTWEAMYAAEGSDWFWWYGDDQLAPAGDKPFDDGFLTHLNNVYMFGKKAGGKFPRRTFAPIIAENNPLKNTNAQGVMAQSAKVSVLFQCDARNTKVSENIFIVGNTEMLGNWKPNFIKMYDNGTHGDKKANDGIWSLEIQFPIGTELQYKYTNSGKIGEWKPSEEFPQEHRTITVQGTEQIITNDIFGKR